MKTPPIQKRDEKNDSVSMTSADFMAEITAPQLRGNGLVEQALKRLREIDAIQHPYGRSHFSDQRPQGKNIVPPELKDYMGSAMGFAILRQDFRSAEAIARIWSLDSEYYENKFAGKAIGVLRLEGRTDLAKPMFGLMLKACLQRWNIDAVHRTENFPPHLNTSSFPEYHNLTMEQESETKNKDTSIIMGLRGATSWFTLGHSLAFGLAATESRIDKGVETAFLQAAVDIITNIKEARPWAIHALNNAIDHKDAAGGSVGEEAWMKSMKSLVSLTSGTEAAVFLRHCSDSFLQTNRSEKKDRAQLIERLAHVVLAQHPTQSSEGWISAEISYSRIFGAREKGHDFSYGRKGILDGDRDIMDTSVIHPRIVQVAETYDILMSWIGASRAHDLSENTHKQLQILANHKGTQQSKLPILRASLDLWNLTNNTLEKTDDASTQNGKQPSKGRRL